MKTLNKVLRSVFLTSLIAVPVTNSFADDTEIYFARATADNSENKPVANVLIMLDTSGSMRFCKDELTGGSGYNAEWCSDYQNRRINMLQKSVSALLDNVSPSIRIGLGRFNYNIDSSGNGSGQKGGRILFPVAPVNDLTKEGVRAELAKLNDAGNSASASSASAQPVGDTPTGRAYSEAARYMMGMEPKYGVSANGANNASACVIQSERQINCRQEVGTWTDWAVVSYCDPSDSSTCRIQSTTGDWYNVSTDCNTSLDNCRIGGEVRISGTCDTASPLCRRQRVFFGYRYYLSSYQKINRVYEGRSPLTYTQVCDTETYCSEAVGILDGTRYKSPMNEANQCESNHVILFTDGRPSNNDQPGNQGFVDCGSNGSYDCQVSIASYLNQDGNAKGRPVKTHNIGLYMGDNQSNMERVSDAGDGSTTNANSADELLNAFISNLDLIDEDSRSISAPGVAVNTMNRFQHLDELYYAVFQPSESSYWEGNIKKYRLNDGQIQGSNGNAIDSSTGYFREGARSYWSSEVDGPDVTKGGARANIGTRRLFYTSEPGGDLARFSWTNTLSPSNEFLGLPAAATTAERTELVSKLQAMWGDPLHSVPVMVNYGEDEENNYVFVSNNGGMLHAIDTSDGSEAFAFMPYEFISRATEYTVSRPELRADNTRLTYGLDGSWIAWRRPGEQVMDAPRSVYLYGGMRRGGRSYYALDVTDPSSPEMLWQISNDTEGFEDLGQTWSTPTLTSIPSDSGSVPVLIFGGGYSPQDHDGVSTRSAADRMGNAVYVVNAETGALIWSAGSSTNAQAQVGAMKWAVPGGVSVVDIDFDGVADHLYFADLGGQVFRVDVSLDSGSLFSVTQLASLSSASGANFRRFYEAPAVGYVKNGANEELYVALGSGNRSHPLDEATNDGFFVIRDVSALEPQSTVIANTTNMTDVTSGSDPATSSRGWFYTFSETGEKSMASPLIYDGRILFTTYAPTEDQEQENVCAVRYGRSFLHTVSLLTARPAALTDEAPTPSSRSEQLNQTNPAPTPTMLVDRNGDLITIVGTEVVGEADPGDLRLRKRRWMQLPKDEANVIRQQESSDEEE
ncbi:PilC/PilY family type IV pilus protein [Halopseudomonas sp.]|uniref:PilC/PilY family type IV pilus protein n=1 Tax=Halopseudomonas sp. TaxID=2901191 RepID=UPI003001AE98